MTQIRQMNTDYSYTEKTQSYTELFLCVLRVFSVFSVKPFLSSEWGAFQIVSHKGRQRLSR
jgi:hypothetical protein